MRRLLALAVALALITLVLAACPTGLLSWSNGPAGNATTDQCATGHTARATMVDNKLGWWIRLGLTGCAVGLLVVNWAVRREPTPTISTDRPAAAHDADEPSGTADAPGNRQPPLLVNDGWHIRNMATALGTFVIEIEAEDPTQTETITRALIEPIRDDYTEILVYVNRLGAESGRLARRMQWTPDRGYIETIFDQPELDR